MINLSPRVREIYRNLLAEWKTKPLYHFAERPNAERLMETGIEPSPIYTHETYKPFGLFTATSMKEGTLPPISQMPFVIQQSSKHTGPLFSPAQSHRALLEHDYEVIRVLPKPGASIKEIEDSVLEDLYNNFNRRLPLNLQNTPVTRQQFYQEVFPNIHILKLKNVDALPGEENALREAIVRIPSAVKMFWGDKMRLIPLTVGLTGVGVAASALTPDEAEAAPIKSVKPTRRALLEKVFKEGVSSVPESILESLFKPGRGKLYRHEWNLKDLIEKGFTESRKFESAKESLEKGGQAYGGNEAETFQQARGLYYYPYKARAEAIRWDRNLPGGEEGINVTGIKRPGAKTWNYTEEADISKDSDFPDVDFINDLENGPRGMEVIQRKPGNVLAKIKTNKGNIYKILGLAGALGAGAVSSLAFPDEAEAAPIKPVKPVGFQVRDLTKGPSDFLSEAAAFLVGKTLPSGAKVMNVQYPHSGTAAARNFREISFLLPDGSVASKQMSKEAIYTLCSTVGYTDYMEKFAQTRSPIKKADMLKASLEQRKKVGLTGTVPQLRNMLADYIAKAEIVNPGVNIDEAQVRFAGSQVNLPRKYMDWALKSGKKSKIPYVAEAVADLKPLYGGKPVKNFKLPFIKGGGPSRGEPFKIGDDYIILYKAKQGNWKVIRVDEKTYQRWNSVQGHEEAKRYYGLSIKTTESEIEDIFTKQRKKYKSPYTRIKYE